MKVTKETVTVKEENVLTISESEFKKVIAKAVNNSIKNIDADDTEFRGYMGLAYTAFGAELVYKLFHNDEEEK